MLDARLAGGLMACALVGTAYALGTEWVASRILGLPLGVWLVGGVMLFAHMRERSKVNGAGAVPVTGGHPFGDMARLVRGAGLADVGSFLKGTMSHRIYSSWRTETDAAPVESARVRVGVERSPRVAVCGPEGAVESFTKLISEDDGVSTRFDAIAGAIRDSGECARRGLAGAVCFSGSGQTTIVLPEHRGRSAAWDDWSSRLALSYPALFPPRVDPARITCGQVDVRSAREARLLARLVEAASVVCMTEARTGAPGSAQGAARQQLRADAAMCALGRALASDWAGTGHSRNTAWPMCRAASRGLSAWLCTHDTQADPQERRRWVEVCATLFADEPESHLRLAAAHIGAYEDNDGLRSLERGFELLRGSGELPLSDPLAFVMAEIELGAFTPLSIGRVAAGLSMAWATTPRENLDYLRDDLADDLRYADKLVGRDQDHALLRRVMTLMERLRSNTLPLRVKPAA